ncbi:MAG: hypothetical protein IPJ69_06035 [Deltaproteobacteria bacterium]|nr:MAG: hypothetical protein IPJ69_06035 [Deltaproteobacteria bacterium]
MISVLMNYIRRGMLLSVLFLVACSGSHSEGSGVQVSVRNAFRPSSLSLETPLPDILQVTRFRVTVTGEGFTPIQVDFPADSNGGDINGVPVGNDRQVLVEAFNSRGDVIRRRLIEGVRIQGDQKTPVVAALLSVPMVTNVRNGGLVRENRVSLAGFGEPASGLEFTEITDQDHPEVLTDLSTSQQAIETSINDGNFAFRAHRLSRGQHTFRVRDTQTGEESILTFTVIASGRVPGTGFGTLGKATTTNIQSISMPGSNMPSVVNVMTK